MRELIFSISEISREMKMARETVSRKLAESGAEPAGQRGGYPVYDLPAIICAFSARAGNRDPDKMSPFELRAYYAAERDRLKLGVEAGNLMRREDVADVLGRLAGPMVRELDTVADRLERDRRIDSDSVAYIRNVMCSTREQMVSVIDSVCKRAETGKEPTP